MKLHHISANATRSGDVEFFVGDVSVQPLVGGDDGVAIAVVRFTPGARTYLHSHASTQVLHCIEGRGVLATKNERFDVGPGDVVHIEPGELHWHGAAPDSEFAHVSIRPPGETTWTKTDPLAE